MEEKHLHHHDHHCGCGHDHSHAHEEEHVHDHCCSGEEDVTMVSLTMEDGSELPCAVLGTFDFEGVEYMALLPESDEFEEDEVFIYGYEELGEDEVRLITIEEEDFDRVAEEFDRLFNQGE